MDIDWKRSRNKKRRFNYSNYMVTQCIIDIIVLYVKCVWKFRNFIYRHHRHQIDSLVFLFSIRFILYKFAHIRNNNIQNSNICKDLSVYATTDFILEINVYFMWINGTFNTEITLGRIIFYAFFKVLFTFQMVAKISSFF